MAELLCADVDKALEPFGDLGHGCLVCSGEVDEALDLVGVQWQSRERVLRGAELRRLTLWESSSERVKAEVRMSLTARELPERAPAVAEDCSRSTCTGAIVE